MSARDAASPVSFFDREELAQLAERARLDVHTGIKGERVKKSAELTRQEKDAMFEREQARLARGLTALRLAARAYALTRDPAGLTPIVWGAWAVRARGRFEAHVDAASRLATAVSSVGPRVLEVPGLAERLASSPLAGVRRALAEALPEGPVSEPILRALATDHDAEVRAAARERIGDDDRWRGAFPIPPDGHPDEVLGAARAVLERSGYERKKRPEEAVEAFAPLGDALAAACWERVLRDESVGGEALRLWLAALLARPGGGAALARLVAVWSVRGRLRFTERALDVAREQVPEPARARAFSELLEAIAAQDAAELANETPRALQHLSTKLVEHALAIAPEDGDARAVLETILGAPIERAGETPSPPGLLGSRGLSEVLERWPLPPELTDALIAARRAGAPGRWDRVGHRVWARLGPDSVLRERAWRDLDGESDQARRDAVRALLGPHHDPAQDGSVEELATRLYERPELRAAVLWTAKSLLPRGREDLERGRLELEAAVAVMAQTPAEAQTDAMWVAARALREQALADPERRKAVFSDHGTFIRAGEEWEPSDLAFARAVVEHALTDETAGLLLRFLIGILERKRGEESAALLRDIDERATTDAQQENVRVGRELSEARRVLERR